MLETDHDCSASDGRAVINVRYQLRVTGLAEPDRTMRVSQLHKALGALATTARRATSLVATGSGSSRGRAAAWLAKATDFTVTGLKPGSTVVEVAALPLGVADPERFAQGDLWDTESHADFTVLDIAARAIEEAKDPDSDGNWFDSFVLESILDFPVSTREPAVSYAMNPVSAHSRHRSFVLDGHAKQGIRKRLQAIAGDQNRLRLRASDSIDLDRITDRWPGDESIEELMAMLD